MRRPRTLIAAIWFAMPSWAAAQALTPCETGGEGCTASDASAWMSGLRLWTSLFAGRSSLAGNAAEGTQDVVASIAGMTLGADKQFGQIVLGGSLGLSHQTFSSGTGGGASDDVAVTLYASQTLFTHAYLAEALGYGWHDVKTSRSLFLADDVLRAKYRAHDTGGRIEGGYSFTPDWGGALSPFAAFVGDSYHQPAYDETSASRASFFAMSYQASTLAITHTELGLRYGDYLGWKDGKSLSVDLLAAWEHELDDNPLVQAAFQTLPGSDFILRGTRPAQETALLGAGLRYQAQDGFAFSARSDARLGARTTIFTASAGLSYNW
ncbi:MAG TPA: autotransporter outer membrane beta-barrel domain-containing protein [Rhodopila sp.]|nr:autotransporter outer membrane beta-barrel domain-containing protein [Rhodopila sp.]